MLACRVQESGFRVLEFRALGFLLSASADLSRLSMRNTATYRLQGTSIKGHVSKVTSRKT